MRLVRDAAADAPGLPREEPGLKVRRRRGEILVEDGVLKTEQVEKAMGDQQRTV
jgi:hypothetical protein